MALVPDPERTYNRPPVTNAIREQSPETATAVVCWLAWPPGGVSRAGAPPGPRETKASIRPFVSPSTRLEAAERNAMQLGAWSRLPSIAGRYEGPLAGARCSPRESSRVLPGFQRVPWLLIEPRRLMKNTSVEWLRSPCTRFEALESNAMIREQRRSPHHPASVSGPAGGGVARRTHGGEQHNFADRSAPRENHHEPVDAHA